jgi:hypothetical protein
MTVSNVTALRPPDAPPPGDEWKKIADVKPYYEFSHRGLVRSLDHTTRGRFYAGKEPLTPRLDGDGYEVVNITYNDGTRKNGVSVARLILLAHDPEGYAPGLQACHGPGGQRDNRWPENLRWDTDEANRADWRRDNPPRPRPLKECVRCGAGFGGNGRRCHPCLVQIGQLGARLLADGADLEAAAEEAGYPSAVGLFRLAVRYGGLRCTVEGVTPAIVVVPEELAAAAKEMFTVRDPQSWLQRVRARWAELIKDGDAQ